MPPRGTDYKVACHTYSRCEAPLFQRLPRAPL